MIRQVAAVLALWTLLGAAAPVSREAAGEPAGARVFVERLYGAYHGKGPDYLGRAAPRVFAPGLLALIRRDQALAKGEVGALDGDPICDCQDFGISRLEIRLKGSVGRATADVRFRNLDADTAVQLDLVRVGGAWRIDNIHTKDTPDLADYLRKHAGGR